ncbi:MAG: ABC transporter substrate-binding protein [Eubacteriaceae bacterium]|jgi:branched-chain amino acid transport system substrate-binding protein|nr:ABC transporter substrate-binding protein [Eubacteriaceae bacterium]
MKKNLLAFLIALLLVAGCTGNNSGGGGGGNSGGGEDKIKVGINFELSGEVATYGSDTETGLMMAIDKVNAAGGVNGKQIEIVRYDNKSEPSEATILATRMMEQDKVIAALGPATSGAFKATIPEADKYKVPVVSASATNDAVTVDSSGNVTEYAFRICFTDSFQGVTMANFALNNLEASTAAIFKDSSNDYAMGLAQSFRSTFEAKGGSISAEEAYVSGETDFRAVLTKIQDSAFDVLFVPGYYQEAGLIIGQARELGINAAILGADGFDSPTLVELAGEEAVSDVYFSNHYSALDNDPTVASFISDYEAAKGSKPNAFNALGYDLANFIVDCISRASELTGEAVKDAIAATQSFVGVTGSFSMGADHNPVKAVVVIEMQNGQQVSATRVAAE